MGRSATSDRALTSGPGAGGLTRRSLVGAAVTSAAVGSLLTSGLARRGGSGGASGADHPFRLIVEQHASRVERLSLAQVDAEMAAGAMAPFSMLGLSMSGAPSARRLSEVRLATRGAEGWSGWTALPYSADEAPDPAEAATPRSTPPVWVGPSDGLMLDVPEDLLEHVTVILVRDLPQVLAAHSDVTPVVSKAGRPSIIGRGTWGARRSRDVIYNSTLKLAIVHHSAGANSYTAGQVPGIIAGIQNYHMDGNGWDDIAYNFVVDKFGRIWEAREGGVTRIVRGGHTAGFNTYNTGICVLADHQTAPTTAAEVSAVGALIAWKCGIHGRDLSTPVNYTAGTGAKRADYAPGVTRSVPVVTMHGNLGVTSCPGSAMRAKVPAIHQSAFARQIGMPDVPVASYFAAPVAWLADRDITTGVGDTGKFLPERVVTRGEMVTFLWRMMGRPPGFPPHGFPDVSPRSYYEDAVRWAKATGVTSGVGDTGRFQPGAAVNRAQMVAFLHRLTGLQEPTEPHDFPDVSSRSYYHTAVSWAQEHGITTGVGDTGRFKPLDPVTRGQMAAFLHRTHETPEAWARTDYDPSDPPG